jgi:3-oxoacyl-[acyl-carrier-protein] synthase II
MRRVVITGAGAVSAFGIGIRPLLDGLARGASAVGFIQSFDASGFSSQVGGEAPVGAIDGDWLCQRTGIELPQAGAWERDGMLRDRKVGFGLVAAAEAWRSAGCGSEDREARLSIAFGMEVPFLQDLVPLFDGAGLDYARENAAGLPRVRFRSPFDLCARLTVEMLGLRGLTAVHASACAGGAMAVAHAASLVQRGEAGMVLCGASDSMLHPMGFGGMVLLGALSPRNQPDACRPFDRRRDGMVIGEGAAMFVVEDEERARARGARPLARVLGWGTSQDAYRLTAPRPDGSAARAAMRRAVERAGLPPTAIGYLNAHGTGTPLNDPAEARAIRSAFGDAADRLPVSSIKGAVGHLIAACGAVELAACLLPFERDLLPGTSHHSELDPDCPIDVIGSTPRPARVDTVLSNSFGFGGQNASIVLGRWA